MFHLDFYKWIRKTQVIPEYVVFYKKWGFYLVSWSGRESILPWNKVTIPFISNSLPIHYENKNSVKKYIPSRTNIMIRKSLHFILRMDSLFPINFQIFPFDTIKRNLVNNFFPKILSRKSISVSIKRHWTMGMTKETFKNLFPNSILL